MREGVGSWRDPGRRCCPVMRQRRCLLKVDRTVGGVVLFWLAADAEEFLIFWEGGWEWARLIGSYDTLGQTPHFHQPGEAA